MYVKTLFTDQVESVYNTLWQIYSAHYCQILSESSQFFRRWTKHCGLLFL